MPKRLAGSELLKMVKVDENKMIDRAFKRICELYQNEFTFDVFHDEDGRFICFSFEPEVGICDIDPKHCFRAIYRSLHAPKNIKIGGDTMKNQKVICGLDNSICSLGGYADCHVCSKTNPKRNDKSEEVMLADIGKLDLNKKYLNALRRAGIFTVNDLAKCTLERFINIRGLDYQANEVILGEFIEYMLSAQYGCPGCGYPKDWCRCGLPVYESAHDYYNGPGSDDPLGML